MSKFITERQFAEQLEITKEGSDHIALINEDEGVKRGGSVGLNSFRGAVKWISALVTLPPGLASAD